MRTLFAVIFILFIAPVLFADDQLACMEDEEFVTVSPPWKFEQLWLQSAQNKERKKDGKKTGFLPFSPPVSSTTICHREFSPIQAQRADTHEWYISIRRGDGEVEWILVEE